MLSSSLRGMMVLTAAMVATAVQAQPTPYRHVDGWAKFPAGRPFGSMVSASVAPDGTLWVFERCGENTCAASNLAPVLAFDPSGNLVKSFGAGLFVFPHGLATDRDGNVYVTDADGKDGKGHTVVKFSPDGKVLMTLGRQGVAGATEETFNRPSSVVVAANGDIFVADGHGGDSNARIVRFRRDGTFIKAWGSRGAGPGQFAELHCIGLDSQGRVIVCDRGNSRIQVFDQDGRFITEWKHFGRPTGLFIDARDNMYVTDTESGGKRVAGSKRGIWIASAKDGTVTAFIPDGGLNPTVSDAPEGVAVDTAGNVYAAETNGRTLRKYAK